MLRPLLFLLGIIILPAAVLPPVTGFVSKRTDNPVRARRVLIFFFTLIFILGMIILAGGNTFWGFGLIIQDSASSFGDFHLVTRFLQRGLIPLLLLFFFISGGIVPYTAVEHRFRGTQAGMFRYLALILPSVILGLMQFVGFAFWYYFVQRVFGSPVLRFSALAGGIALILGSFGCIRRLLIRISFRHSSIPESEEKNLSLQIESAFGETPPEIFVVDTNSIRWAFAWIRNSIKPMIYLSSTLFSALTEKEKTALIGHEMVRLRLYHTRKSNIVTICLVTLATWLLFGVIADIVPAGQYRNLVFYSLSFLCYLVLVFAIPRTLRKHWARRADMEVAAQMGGPEPLVSVLRKIHGINAGYMSRGNPGYSGVPAAINRRIERLHDVFDSGGEAPTEAALNAYRNASAGDDATAAAIKAYRNADKKSQKRRK